MKKFDVTLFGDDAIEQIANMKFTEREQIILDFVFSQDEKYTDEEYYNISYSFAENNGLNEKGFVVVE
jgi:hypothetical protein